LTYEFDWLKKKSEEIIGHRPTPPHYRQN